MMATNRAVLCRFSSWLLAMIEALVQMPGARREITVDGKPRSHRVDRQIAVSSAQYLSAKIQMSK